MSSEGFPMAGLPEPSQIAVAVFLMTATIVIMDGWKLLRAHREIPNIGPFANGGMAWKSRFEQELVRNMTMLGAIAVMIVVPWFLAERSGTDVRFVILFDILLAIHGPGMPYGLMDSGSIGRGCGGLDSREDRLSPCSAVVGGGSRLCRWVVEGMTSRLLHCGSTRR